MRNLTLVPTASRQCKAEALKKAPKKRVISRCALTLLVALFLFSQHIFLSGFDKALAADFSDGMLPLVTDQVGGQTSLSPHLGYFVDRHGRLTLEDVISPVYQNRFIRLADGLPPTTIGAFWLRLTLVSSGPRHNQRLEVNLGPNLPGGRYTVYMPEPAEPYFLGRMATRWKTLDVEGGTSFVLPLAEEQPITIYVRLEGLPHLWFAPTVNIEGVQPDHSADIQLALLALSALAAIIAFARGILQANSEKLWTGLYSLLLLTQTYMPLVATVRGIIPVSGAPFVIAPGLALLILSQLGRVRMSTDFSARHSDSILRLCSWLGALLALLPLTPGLAWTARYLLLWPTLCLPVFVVALLCLIIGLEGAVCFFICAALSLIGAVAAIGLAFTELPPFWASYAPLLGTILGALVLALSNNIKTNRRVSIQKTLPEDLDNAEHDSDLATLGLYGASSGTEQSLNSALYAQNDFEGFLSSPSHSEEPSKIEQAREVMPSTMTVSSSTLVLNAQSEDESLLELSIYHEPLDNKAVDATQGVTVSPLPLLPINDNVDHAPSLPSLIGSPSSTGSAEATSADSFTPEKTASEKTAPENESVYSAYSTDVSNHEPTVSGASDSTTQPIYVEEPNPYLSSQYLESYEPPAFVQALPRPQELTLTHSEPQGVSSVFSTTSTETSPEAFPGVVTGTPTETQFIPEVLPEAHTETQVNPETFPEAFTGVLPEAFPGASWNVAPKESLSEPLRAVPFPAPTASFESPSTVPPTETAQAPVVAATFSSLSGGAEDMLHARPMLPDEKDELSKPKAILPPRAVEAFSEPLSELLHNLAALSSCSLAPMAKVHAESAAKSGQALMELAQNFGITDRPKEPLLSGDRRPFDIYRMLSELHDEHQSRTQEKGLGLSWFASPRLSHRFEGDGLRLKAVLSNLLDDAIQASHTGNIQFSARLTEGSSDPGMITFTISDNRPENARHDTAENKAVLDAIKFANANNGALNVSHDQHSGSVVSFSAHFTSLAQQKKAHNEAANKQDNQPESPSLARAVEQSVREKKQPEVVTRPSCLADKALVLDMAAGTRGQMLNLLSRLGIPGEEARFAPEALELYSKEPVKLVTVNADMSESDLAHFIGELRSLERLYALGRVHILAITGNIAQAQRLVSMGCDKALTKPFSFGSIHEALTYLCPELITEAAAHAPEVPQQSSLTGGPTGGQPEKASAFRSYEEPSNAIGNAHNAPLGNNAPNNFTEGDNVDNANRAESIAFMKSVMDNPVVPDKDTIFPLANLPVTEIRPRPQSPLLTELDGKHLLPVPGLDYEGIEPELVPLLPGLIADVREALLHASQARDRQSAIDVQEAVTRLAGKAQSFGLSKLEGIAACVGRAAAADDIAAVSDLMLELDNTTAKHIEALQNLYDAEQNKAKQA